MPNTDKNTDNKLNLSNSNLEKISDLYNKAVKNVKNSPKNEVKDDLISEMVNSLLNLKNKDK